MAQEAHESLQKDDIMWIAESYYVTKKKYNIVLHRTLQQYASLSVE